MRAASWPLTGAILILTGCTLLAGRSFELTLPAPGELGDPLPVILTDATGMVVGVEEPGLMAFDPGSKAVLLPGEHNAVYVSWIGGLCDERVRLRLEDRQGALWLVGATERAPEGCRAAGVGRAIVIRFTLPIDVDRFTVEVD